MATQARVELAVDESGVAPALTRLQQRAQGAVTPITAELGRTATAGTKAGDAMAAGFQKANQHALTNLDTVRLMRDDLGVHIPRAMERLISQSQAFQTVAKLAFGGFAALGFLELAGQVGSKLWDWSKAMMGDTKAAEDLRQKLVEINNQAIVDPKNIDQARANLQLMISEAKRFEEAKNKSLQPTVGDAVKYAWAGPIGGAVSAYNKLKSRSENSDAAQQAETMQQEINAKTAQLNSEFNDRKRRADDENTENALKGVAKLRQQNKDANDELDRQVHALSITRQQADQLKAENNRKYALEEQKQNEEDAKTASATARRERDERIAMQNEAVNAGLKGEALYDQERIEGIAKVKQAYLDGEISKRTFDAETASLNLKFDNERAERMKEQMDQAQKAFRDAQAEGLTGLAKIRADRASHNSDIDAMDISPDAKRVRHQAVDLTANQQEGAYWQQNDEDEGEQQQRRAEQQARNREQDLQYEREAAQAERRVRSEGMDGWVSDYRAAVAEIQSQRTEQLQKVDDDAKTEGLTDQEIAQRRVDIERTADAQIAEENRQMAHTLSQTLQEAFTNPVEFIKSRMQQMFFEIVAEWLERSKMFQSLFGQQMGSLQPGAHSGGILGSLGIGGPRPTFGGSPTMGSTAGGYTPIGSGGGGDYSSGGGGGTYSGGGSSAGSAASSVVGSVGQFRSLYKSAQTARNTPGSPVYSGSQSGVGYGTTVDADGNVTLTGDIPSQSDPTYQIPSASSGSTAASAMNTGMGIVGAGMAGYQGYQDTKADFKSGSAGGTLKGMGNDAMAGAAIGMMFGPEGALIGAAAGAIVGAVSGITGAIMGEGGRLAARDYYKKSIFPSIEQIRNGDGGDWMSEISQVNSTASSGMNYMSHKWGTGAAQWVDDNYLRKEQTLAVGQIEARARGGSYAVSMSAPSFHSGTDSINSFGDLATSSNEGFMHAMLGEAVVNPVAASTHRPAISAMNSGASPADIGAMYGGGASSSTGDTHHWHVSALDVDSFRKMLRSGGQRVIQSEANKFVGRYAGDGIV